MRVVVRARVHVRDIYEFDSCFCFRFCFASCPAVAAVMLACRRHGLSAVSEAAAQAKLLLWLQLRLHLLTSR